ncbi:hypothetical protein Hypma_016578 [Hypsizygus marmoreus]|uniref:Uncharacterized protein n=1 Tax=Hypsizygus marmoreus TaxID=39966 RepID=A0A369J259_HYPMA|nr:hypothetical protein Hypma_016578 [Hypsizygus marmoreus]
MTSLAFVFGDTVYRDTAFRSPESRPASVSSHSSSNSSVNKNIPPVPIQRSINYPLYMVMTAPKDIWNPEFFRKLVEFSQVSVEVSQNEHTLLRLDEFAILREGMISLAKEENQQHELANLALDHPSRKNEFMDIPGPAPVVRRICISHAAGIRDCAPKLASKRNGGAFYRLRRLEHQNLQARLQRAQLEVDLLSSELELANSRLEVEESSIKQEYCHDSSKPNEGFPLYVPFPYEFSASSSADAHDELLNIPHTPPRTPTPSLRANSGTSDSPSPFTLSPAPKDAFRPAYIPPDSPSPLKTSVGRSHRG